MITEIEIKDNLDWFIDNNFEVKITNSPLHPFPSSNKSSAMMDNVKKMVKLRISTIFIVKNLWNIYNLKNYLK